MSKDKIVKAAVDIASEASSSTPPGAAADAIVGTAEVAVDAISQEQQAGDKFFRNQIYQQSLEANAGWTILMQAMVGQASKTIANTQEGEASIDMGALEKLMSLSKTMQMDTLGIMQAMRTMDKDA